ncbi:MAG: hypothetical protein OK438_03945 [Thaumarchaeota archaeon]|nr:hypothetical protein [Nitrososphaerota archaeon]
MSQDPASIFGGLMLGCIRDRYVGEGRRVLVEGAVSLALGLCASVATTYLLSLAGIFV